MPGQAVPVIVPDRIKTEMRVVKERHGHVVACTSDPAGRAPNFIMGMGGQL